MGTTARAARDLAAGAVVLALVATASPGAAGEQRRGHPFAGETDWVAYSTYRDGREGTWLVHPDGTGDHEIATDIGRTAILPDWSPDGERIVLTVRGGGSEPLYEYHLATGTSTQVFDCTYPCLGDDEPAYSPDGRSMAFVRYQGPLTEDWIPTDCALWIGDLATDALTRLTSDPDCDKPYAPRWSPGGEHLAFHRERPTADGGFEAAVFTIRRDGTGERRLTDWDLSAGTPDWSPDGRWIVFSTRYGSGERAELVRMRPDGSDLQVVASFGGVSATQPRYTPDGEWILLTALQPREGWPRQRSLWAVPAEGGGDRVVVAHTERIYTHGTWQP